MKCLILLALVAFSYAAPPPPAKTVAIGDKTISVGEGFVDVTSPFNRVHIQKVVDPVSGETDVEITVRNPFSPVKTIKINDKVTKEPTVIEDSVKEKRATKSTSQVDILSEVCKKYQGNNVTDIQYQEFLKKVEKYVEKGVLHKIIFDVLQAISISPISTEPTKPVVTPWFSINPDGTRQITTPWFSADILKPTDPFLPSSFEFRTPFSVQPEYPVPSTQQVSVLEQINEQANTQQQTALQQLVSLIGYENVEVLFNALMGQYSQITSQQCQNFVQVLEKVGQPKVQELLSTFAGEKLTFPTQYGQKIVKLPQIVLDKVLEQLKQQVDVPTAQFPVQYQGQYPVDQTPYRFPFFQDVISRYPQMYGSIYGQQPQYQPTPVPYGQQYQYTQQVPFQYGQQIQYPQQTQYPRVPTQYGQQQGVFEKQQTQYPSVPTQYGQQQGVFGQQQTQYPRVSTQYGQQQGVYGQQQTQYPTQYAPKYPYQYSQQYTVPQQYGQQGQYYQGQSTVTQSTVSRPFTQDYQQTQYQPFQQYAQGLSQFAQYQPNTVAAH